MKKRLYLDDDSLGFVFKAKEQTGEQLGGKYSARVQTGIEKDGSPQYRYFETQAEYEEYLSKQRKAKTGEKGKGDNKGSKERLESKLKKEQGKSSKYAKEPQTKKVSGSHSKNRSLYAGSTASVKKFSVKKSINLYIGEK